MPCKKFQPLAPKLRYLEITASSKNFGMGNWKLNTVLPLIDELFTLINGHLDEIWKSLHKNANLYYVDTKREVHVTQE